MAMRGQYFDGGGYTDKEYNGLHGEFSPEAILNALSESGKKASTGNAFDAMFKYSTDFPKPGPFDGPQSGVPMTPPKTFTAPGLQMPPNLFPGGTPRMEAEPAPIPQGTSPGNPRTRGVAPTPSPAAPAGQSDVERWASSDPQYAWLRNNPDGLTSYYAEAARLKSLGEEGIDAADYLKHKYPLMTHPGFMRTGKDTYGQALERIAAREAAPAPNAPPVTPGGGGTNPGGSPAPVGTFPGGPPPPLFGGPGGVGHQPPAPTGGAPTGGNDYLANLDRALRLSQDKQAQDALRQFRAAGSASGMENSGSYLTGQQDLVGDLATEFGAERARALMGASEAERGRQFSGEQNELDRVLQRYGIQVGADTSRANANTAAGAANLATQMSYSLGQQGIEVDKARLTESIRNNTLMADIEAGRLGEAIRNNTLGYNLGVGEQDLRRELGGQANQIDLFKLLADIGPEALLRSLFGEQGVPGVVGFTP